MDFSKIWANPEEVIPLCFGTLFTLLAVGSTVLLWQQHKSVVKKLDGNFQLFQMNQHPLEKWLWLSFFIVLVPPIIYSTIIDTNHPYQKITPVQEIIALLFFCIIAPSIQIGKYVRRKMVCSQQGIVVNTKYHAWEEIEPITVGHTIKYGVCKIIITSKDREKPPYTFWVKKNRMDEFEEMLKRFFLK